MKTALMDDSENMAVRMFLALYGGQSWVTVKLMRDHLRNCGFAGEWPDWVNDADGHLTKGGAQDWLRYLFALEETK